jgi:hypothetical protein
MTQSALSKAKDIAESIEHCADAAYLEWHNDQECTIRYSNMGLDLIEKGLEEFAAPLRKDIERYQKLIALQKMVMDHRRQRIRDLQKQLGERK